MQVLLSIVRYKKKYIPFAFMSMAIFRFPLWRNKNVRFFKLMGTGRNGTFDKVPDLQQWAILTATDSSFANATSAVAKLHQHFIRRWYKLFGCETLDMLLESIEGHGTWDGKNAFGNLPAKSDYEGRIAVLTRATIRLNKLGYFWKHVAPVAEEMSRAPGFTYSIGVGEIPWIKQATFSIWESKAAMKAFAYGTKTHAEVVMKTRQQKWYSEDMFTRFRILDIDSRGDWPGITSGASHNK